MKGKLHKTKDGYWKVLYTVHHPKVMVKEYNMSLPLHPNNVIDVEQHIDATKISHNLQPNMEVEFEIVKEYTDSHTNQVQSYAKLVKREDSLHFPTTDVDQVPDVRKMVEDDVEKYKKSLLSNEGLILAYQNGYNKAKSTLYTEEDIDKILSMYTDDAPASYIKRDYKKYLKSLKQPKQ